MWRHLPADLQDTASPIAQRAKLTAVMEIYIQVATNQFYLAFYAQMRSSLACNDPKVLVLRLVPLSHRHESQLSNRP
jgi:hypothetical protein